MEWFSLAWEMLGDLGAVSVEGGTEEEFHLECIDPPHMMSLGTMVPASPFPGACHVFLENFRSGINSGLES